MCKRFIKNRRRLAKSSIKRRAGFLNPKTAVVFLLILSIMGSLYYLGLINHRATAGYRIAALEKKINNLKELNQKLELQATSLGKVENIRQVAENMKMVVVKEVDYLLVADDGLALR